MLSERAIEVLKKDWVSFEQVQKINNTLERMDNWTEKMYDKEEGWEKLYKNIKIILIKY